MIEGEAALQTYLGISGRSSEGAVLRLLINLGCQVVGADEGSLLALDKDHNQLVFTMVTSSQPARAAVLTRLPTTRTRVSGLAPKKVLWPSPLANTAQVRYFARRFASQAPRGISPWMSIALARTTFSSVELSIASTACFTMPR